MPDQSTTGAGGLMARFKSTGLWWLWLALLAVVLDQASKLWILANIDLYERIPVLPVFNITYVRNYGAAFSFLADAGGWQRYFLTAIAVVISVLLVWWMNQIRRENRMLGSAYALVLGGAIGNLYDRMAYGYVVDFIHVYYQDWHFPAFNIADSAITLGAVLLIADALFNSDSDKQEQDQSEKTP